MSLVVTGDNVSGCTKHGPCAWRSDCDECRITKLPPPQQQDVILGCVCDPCKENEAMLRRMQTPEARKGMERAFDATPEELGRAAIEFARKQKEKQ